MKLTVVSLLLVGLVSTISVGGTQQQSPELSWTLSLSPATREMLSPMYLTRFKAPITSISFATGYLLFELAHAFDRQGAIQTIRFGPISAVALEKAEYRLRAIAFPYLYVLQERGTPVRNEFGGSLRLLVQFATELKRFTIQSEVAFTVRNSNLWIGIGIALP